MKKIIRAILRVTLLLIIAFSMFSFSACNKKASGYSEEEHIERVSKLVEKRYMTDDSEYTSYEVFPLYNENEELKFFVVEFEPYGFVYVKLNDDDRSGFWQHSMYTRCSEEGNFIWRRYTVEIGLESTMNHVTFHDRRWEIDENGEYVDYYDSHFKVANIQNEKRYFLTITQKGVTGYIPAVRRDNKYLNLVSMQEIVYEREIDSTKYATADVSFFLKAEFNL